MARRFGLALVVFAAAAALAPAAVAKEIDSVTITGPGLDRSISLAGGRHSLDADTPIARLVQESGFFPEVFDTAPDPTLTQRPKGDLGPRYVALYVFPNPENGERPAVLVQVGRAAGRTAAGCSPVRS